MRVGPTQPLACTSYMLGSIKVETGDKVPAPPTQKEREGLMNEPTSACPQCRPSIGTTNEVAARSHVTQECSRPRARNAC